MVARDLRYVVLGEDTAHGNFVRRWLIAEGVEPRNIRLIPPPAGTGGAGDEHVKRKYPEEVAYYRRRANAQRVALVIVIDADRETVRHRQRQLDEALSENQSPPRADPERIAILVPKRNIETWLHTLPGTPADEETDYKPLFVGKTAAACAAAAPHFQEFLQRTPSDTDLPSLAASRSEAARLV
ncbi:MAG TPA: hypothetical protein VH877_18500 [Polyangia bacterium]|jgi:hypothetical protein|nr:hypothetical protein [Polyangia bacterium]